VKLFSSAIETKMNCWHW